MSKFAVRGLTDSLRNELRDMARGKKRILVGRDVRIPGVVARLLPSTYDRIVARCMSSDLM